MADKWGLWASGKTRLRGANIWLEVNGDPGKQPIEEVFSPIYGEKDFHELREWHANYVHFSVPGIFTVDSIGGAYQLWKPVALRLDQLIRMASDANLYTVLAFRTGPGRSEKGFDHKAVNQPPEWHLVWTDNTAMTAWETMWEQAASRYMKYSNIVGYEIMVEPNANDVLFRKKDEAEGKYTGTDKMEKFIKKYGGTGYNWHRLAKRIALAIRKVDQETPIIVSTMDWGSPAWLDAIKPQDQISTPRTLYSVHCYDPYIYTSEADDKMSDAYTYPGEIDIPGTQMNKKWLEKELRVIDAFKAAPRHKDIPIAVTEFGPIRWKCGADRYLRDLTDILEAKGLNHAIWVWDPSNIKPEDEHGDDWNFKFGPNKVGQERVKSSLLIEAIRRNWNRNDIFPA